MNEDKASRYHRLKRTTGLLSLVWSAILLGGLLFTGGSIGLRNLAQAFWWGAVPHPALTVAVYVTLLSLVNEVVSLPLSFYSGFLIERRTGSLIRRLAAGWSTSSKVLEWV